eukprot:58472-Chlamydomonas_euryale.AAC.2
MMHSATANVTDRPACWCLRPGRAKPPSPRACSPLWVEKFPRGVGTFPSGPATGGEATGSPAISTPGSASVHTPHVWAVGAAPLPPRASLTRAAGVTPPSARAPRPSSAGAWPLPSQASASPRPSSAGAWPLPSQASASPCP